MAPALGSLCAAQPAAGTDELTGERLLSRLKWRCRRGLLENDLFIERFFKRFENSLTVRQAQALSAMMELSDNDLLDLHLARKPLAQRSEERRVGKECA